MLSGEVYINDQQIVRYTAINTLRTYAEGVEYECNATGRNQSGYPYRFEFSVIHEPNDGAEILVAKIMEYVRARKTARHFLESTGFPARVGDDDA